MPFLYYAGIAFGTFLLKPLTDDDEEEGTTEVVFKTLCNLIIYIQSNKIIQPGLKHNSIHCVSFTRHFATLIGFSLSEFANLFFS